MSCKVRIGDLGEIITGNTPPRNKPEYYGTHTPFIKATDIDESAKYTYAPEESYSEIGYQKYRKSLVPKGSTCVVTIGSIGKKMTMAHCDCFINQAMNAIIPSPSYDPEYVYYVVKHNVHRLKSLDSGTASGRENVSKSAFSNLEIDIIDDIDIQRKIGQVLSTYDALIENNQKQIKLLEEAARRLYKEWFVDLHFPDYETTPIVDGIPEGWKTQSLSQIADIVMGQSPKSEFYNQDGHGLPFHQGVGSYGTRFVIDTTYSTSFTRIAEAGSILFSVRAPVGRLNMTKNKVVIGRGLAAINHRAGMQSYLFYLLKERFFKDDIIGNGAIFASISKDELLGQEFVVPTDALVERFNVIANSIDKKIAGLSDQIALLTEARDRLLPKLMNGEIEI